MWAPQQAARARQRASPTSNRRRDRRIRRGRLRPHYRGRLHTHYRVSGPSSSETSAGRDGRPPFDGRPTRAKNRERGWKSRYFAGSEGIAECSETRRLRAAIWNRDSRGIEFGPPIPPNQFHAISARRGQPRGKNSLRRSGLASRTPCRLLSRLRVIETIEPGNMRLNAPYRISAVREECARGAGASKCPRRNLNLPLAAGPRVRHIRADGAVAEWLKAAVC